MMRLLGRVVMSVTVCMTLAFGIHTLRAGAEQHGAVVAVDDPQPVAGEVVTVEGSGFGEPVQEVLLQLDGDVVAQMASRADGTVSANLTIPTDLSGRHVVELVGLGEGDQQVAVATATIEVTSAPTEVASADVNRSPAPAEADPAPTEGAQTELAFTGLDGVLLQAAVGIALLMMGMFAVARSEEPLEEIVPIAPALRPYSPWHRTHDDIVPRGPRPPR